MAAQTLREAGYRGRIVLVGPEATLPCDRPSLSKNYLGGKPLDTARCTCATWRSSAITPSSFGRDRVTKLDASTKDD